MYLYLHKSYLAGAFPCTRIWGAQLLSRGKTINRRSRWRCFSRLQVSSACASSNIIVSGFLYCILGVHLWEMTPRMVQNDMVLSGNVPKWGQYPVGVFPGCKTKTLRHRGGCPPPANPPAALFYPIAPLVESSLLRT